MKYIVYYNIINTTYKIYNFLDSTAKVVEVYSIIIAIIQKIPNLNKISTLTNLNLKYHH